MTIQFQLMGCFEQLAEGIQELNADLDVALCAQGTPLLIRQLDGADLQIQYDGKNAAIIYDKPHHFFRCYSLLVQHLRAGEQEFSITEHSYFSMNGPMFDGSQANACMNIPTLKKTIRQMAQMGLNMLMLYCEDSFTVKEQPYFGYMRPRYSEQDMKELDDYAFLFGIEVIPCIQTLAHLVDMLKWSGVYRPIKENDVCLLVGEDETYKFIRDLLVTATRPLRTRRIHIGMDEAYKLGRGPFLDKHGLMPVADIMKMHLDRVMEIIRELGLQPMMWSDMLFHEVGGHHSGKPIPQESADRFPKDMQMVHWNYYYNDEETHELELRCHFPLGKPIFAGGIWTWVGFGPHWNRTFLSTEAGLNACKKLGIDEVFATIWGDNGTEAPMEVNVLGLALYAEHGYSERIDYQKLKERFEFITGASYEDFLLLEGLDNTPGVEDTALTDYNPSKYLLWQDIMTGLCDKNIEGLALNAHYEALAKKLLEASVRNGAYNEMFSLYAQVAHTLALKSEMGLRLTDAYRAGRKEELKEIALVQLPDLKERMTILRSIHMKVWFRLYKHLGWDIMDMRYGSLLTRIDSAITEINQYLDGSLARLEELEEERLDYNGKPGLIRYLNYFGRIVSASRIAPYC